MVVQSVPSVSRPNTYAIATLQQISSKPVCQALVILPTRELAAQVCRTITGLAGPMPNGRTHLCARRVPVDDSIRALQDGVQTVVGTACSVLELMHRLSREVFCELKILVYDEIDEISSRGFEQQMHEIVAYAPADVQHAAFSATTPWELLQFAETHMKAPMKFAVQRDEPTLGGIKQSYVAVGREEWKLDTLCDLYETLTIPRAIIYCNDRCKVDWLVESLHSRDFTVPALHGDMNPGERELIIES